MSDETTPTTDSHGRGQNGRFIRTVESAERDSLAARMRARGHSYREIAERLKYADESGAAKAVSRALAAVPVAAVEELRALECERLDELSRRLWRVFDTKYPLITDGPELVDKNGQYVEDPTPLLAVVDRLLRISAQRAKLLGLNAEPPREPEVSKPAPLELTGEQAALLQQLAQALAIEPAALPTGLLALPQATDTPRETA